MTLFRRHIALPSDHGSWVFLISPLLIGLFAGGRFTFASALLIVAAFAGFLLRQPVTMIVKAYSGRRAREDLPAAQFWTLVYALIGLVSVGGLLAQGFVYLLLLAIPAVPVFVWHLYLISQRAERRQIGIELVGSGVLALAAPAAYWVALGTADAHGWWLWLLTWLQSAASIVYAYLRLEQRVLPSQPPSTQQWQMGQRALMYTTANCLIAIVLSLWDVVTLWLLPAYLVQWLETLWGITHPAVGVKPVAIGIRQTIVSTLFTVLFIVGWR